jgi:hypothetical protein
LQVEYDQLVKEFNDKGFGYVLANYGSEEFPEELIREVMLLYSRISTTSNAMRELSDDSISTILQDTVLNTNMLKEWYEVVRTPIAKYLLAETCFFTGDYERADATLAEIPKMFEFDETEIAEHSNYIQFHNFKKELKLNKRDWSELSEAEIAHLQQIAEANTGRSSSMAKGPLCFFFGICYDEESSGTEPPIFAAPSPDFSVIEPEAIENFDFGHKVSIYPNPTSGNLQVTSYELRVTSVDIFDVLGRNAGAHPCGGFPENANNTHIQIDISHLTDGIYVVKVHLSNGEVVVQRLVKQ